MYSLLYFVSLLMFSSAEWHYQGDIGPDNWVKNYPICGGTSQSPININTLKVRYSSALPPFNFSGYETLPAGATYTLKNNGYVAKVTLKADDKKAFSISGGGLPATYVADHFHFHWGGENHQGSEHVVNGDSFPLEVHIVHYSSDYDGVRGAADKDQGLAVLGFFFQIGVDYSRAFDEVCDNLANITHSGAESSLIPFHLCSLLPEDLSSYWRYRGSLTTPPCYESVIWTVFQTPIIISEAQLNKFRSLVFESEGSNSTSSMVDTYRPVQPLFGRTVYSSARGTEWDRLRPTAAAPALRPSASLAALVLWAALFH